MGYPMTYPRVVLRNGLDGNYAATSRGEEAPWKKMIAGDLRRLELDAQDDIHIARFAKAAGISKPKAAAVLKAFFTYFGQSPTPFLAQPCWPVSVEAAAGEETR